MNDPAQYNLAVIGDGRVRRSLSPRMHNHVLAKHGLAGGYGFMAVSAEEVEWAVEQIVQTPMTGANVTVPHKRAVMEYLHELAPTARRVGAVNTIINDNGRLVGDNTDAGGFLDALAQVGFSPEGRAALIIGAGGASRALVAALVEAGATVMLAARRDEAASSMAAKLGGRAVAWNALEHTAAKVNLLVNATAASTAEEGPELARRAQGLPLAPDGLVYDINYGRQGNFWQALARKAHCRFCDGLPMLVHQARRSFALWTGITAPAEDFLEALEGDAGSPPPTPEG